MGTLLTLLLNVMLPYFKQDLFPSRWTRKALRKFVTYFIAGGEIYCGVETVGRKASS